MRVTLNQDELFEAIGFYLRDKLSLNDTAKVEISFTAGRGPKGYSADVDITYPKSDTASRFVAAEPRSDDGAEPADLPSNPHAEALSPSTDTNPAAAGTNSAGDIFS